MFEELTPARLNEELNGQMEGLSAKVFRTYNASVTLEDQLAKLTVEHSLTKDLPAGEHQPRCGVARHARVGQAAPPSTRCSRSPSLGIACAGKDELAFYNPKEDSAKTVLYNSANREVAILCNHQRTVPKAFHAAMEKLHAKVSGARGWHQRLAAAPATASRHSTGTPHQCRPPCASTHA